MSQQQAALSADFIAQPRERRASNSLRIAIFHWLLTEKDTTFPVVVTQA